MCNFQGTKMYLSIRPNQGYKTYPHVPGFAPFWYEQDEIKPYQTDFVLFWPLKCSFWLVKFYR